MSTDCFARVAQISNLPYRRASSLRDSRIIQRAGRFAWLPIGNRRNSRLEICATRSQRICRLGVVAAAWLSAAGCVLGATPKRGPESALLVVMDPLAKELACACVKGYGQRDYRKIAARLEKA